MLLVDANVVLDVLTADPHCCTWSEKHLQRFLDAGPVADNVIVYD